MQLAVEQLLVQGPESSGFSDFKSLWDPLSADSFLKIVNTGSYFHFKFEARPSNNLPQQFHNRTPLAHFLLSFLLDIINNWKHGFE
jgi:hypothetical protein